MISKIDIESKQYEQEIIRYALEDKDYLINLSTVKPQVKPKKDDKDKKSSITTGYYFDSGNHCVIVDFMCEYVIKYDSIPTISSIKSHLGEERQQDIIDIWKIDMPPKDYISDILNKKIKNKNGQDKVWEMVDDINFNDGKLAEVVFDVQGLPGFGDTETDTFIDEWFATGKELYEMDFTPSEFYIYPLLKKNSVTLISGSAGVGKTLFTMSILKALLNCDDFIHYTNRCDYVPKIMYIDGELGGGGIVERFKAMKIGNDENIIVMTDKNSSNDLQNNKPDISKIEDQSKLNKVIKKLDPEIIVLDNLFTLTNIDTNSAQEFNNINDWMSKLRNDNRTVILIHHTTKEEAQYGSVNHETIVDASYLLKKVKNNQKSDIQLTLTWNKYRPIVENTDDRNKIDNVVFDYNTILQKWDYMDDKSNEVQIASNELDFKMLKELIRLDDDGKPYTYDQIGGFIGKSGKTVQRFVTKDKNTNNYLIISGNSRTLTSKGQAALDLYSITDPDIVGNTEAFFEGNKIK